MANYQARGYYIDPNGRRGDFVVESPSSSRSQIERIVRNRYDVGREVRINMVDDGGRAERERQERQRRDQERLRYDALERDLEDSGSNFSNTGTSSPRSRSSVPEGGPGCGVVLLGLIGIIALGAFSGEDLDNLTTPRERTYEAPVEQVEAAPVPEWVQEYAPEQEYAPAPQPEARQLETREEPIAGYYDIREHGRRNGRDR